MSEKSILGQIAEQYGITTKTVTRRIKEHPELGIEMEKRKTTVLNEAQIQGLCKILDDKYKQPRILNETIKRVQDMSGGDLEHSQDSLSQSLESLRELERLKDEVAQLKADLAAEKARSEERLERINDLKRQAEEFPKLLAAGQEEIANLKEEVTEAREEWKNKGLLDRWFKR